MTASIPYILSCTNLQLNPQELIGLLSKMSLKASWDASRPEVLNVEIPVTRSDILHECDIMEDVAIAYGFNKLVKTIPKTSTVGKKTSLAKLSDAIRREIALAGFTEVLPLILVGSFLLFLFFFCFLFVF